MEFRQTKGRTGTVRYWRISRRGDLVSSEWGAIVNGEHKKHGETEDVPGPKGKEGTAAWVSAENNAKFHLERLVRKKTEEGYVEVDQQGNPLTEVTENKIDHSKPLPKKLCFCKPKNSGKDGPDLIYTRKVNGMCVIAQVMSDPDETVRLYSRRMDDLTGHFPHLVKALTAMKVPPGSILMFEAFMGDGNSKADLLKCQSIMRSKRDKALGRQEDIGWMKFYLYRIPCWREKDLERKATCYNQLCAIVNAVADKFEGYRDPDVGKDQFLFPVEIFEGTWDEALNEATSAGYEGWVVYKRDGSFGDYTYGFHGKADRPSCCFKLKLEITDDFVAFFNPDKSTKEKPQGTWGSGKNMGKVGTLSLYQYDNAGNLHYICDTSGFDDATRDELTARKSWPIVVEVKYNGRGYLAQGDGSNALEFPRFQRVRTDKDREECIDALLTSD
jgi:ATP-dependent DNA ligase